MRRLVLSITVTTTSMAQNMVVNWATLEETAAVKAPAVVAATAAEDASAGAITKSARSLAKKGLIRLAHAEGDLTRLAPTLAERAPSTPPAHAARSLTPDLAARSLSPDHAARNLAPSPARRPRSARSLSPATRRSPSLARRSPRSARRWSRRSSLSLPADLAQESPADRTHTAATLATVSEDDGRLAYTTLLS